VRGLRPALVLRVVRCRRHPEKAKLRLDRPPPRAGCGRVAAEGWASTRHRGDGTFPRPREL